MSEKEINVTSLYYDYVLDNNYDCVVQVGGRFSGKSHNEQIRLVGNLASKENYKLLVIEDLETGMSEGFHAGLYARIRDFEHESAYTPESKVAHIRNLINNNSVIFRGYATEQQKLNVKKLSGITEILVEEGEWMTYDDFMGLYQQLRGGDKSDRKLTILLNPVNPNCFVNECLIEAKPDKILSYFDGTKRPKVFEKHISTTFEIDGEQITETIKILVVLSTHYDNEFLTLEQRASIEQYRDSDPDKYLQLGEARFIRPSGTYFREFKKEIHVITPFIIPRHWRRYVSVDYGLDMLAVYWIAVDEQNKAYVYKEYCESNLIASDAGKKIKEMTLHDEEIYQYIAPSDLDNCRQETGKSVLDIWRELGLYFRICSNNRVQGWYNVKEYLKPYKDEQGILTANMVFFENCTTIIDYLPRLLRDDKNPNDVAKEPHFLTHSSDSIRYFANARVYPTKPAKNNQFVINSTEEKAWNNLEKIVKNKSKKRKVYW